MKGGKTEPGRELYGAEAGSKITEPQQAVNAVMPSAETPWASCNSPCKWRQHLRAKNQHFSGQRRGWDLSGCFGHLQGLSASFSPSFRGNFSLTWQAHSEIQQCQQGALSGTLSWQPLHLLPPLLLEAKNQVFCLIGQRTCFLRVFSPVIKLFGCRMYYLNPFCSKKWG